MINIQKIHDAIDAFIKTDPEERYEIHIPSRKGKKRNYLGLSGLGEECARKVFYNWRQAKAPEFPPRILRLFRRGDREEYIFNYLYNGIGFTVHDVDADGKQFAVSDFEGHLSGHTDGVLEIPKEFWLDGKPHPVLSELKTYNKARFAKLVKDGVEKSDPKYYVQMQGYMGYEDLKGALFAAVCKDDDSLHFEYTPFKKFAFRRMVDLADDIIHAQEPPPRLSNNPSWWQCKFCDFHGICHSGEPSAVSCRSCKFATPGRNKSWNCEKGQEYGDVCKQYKDITK